MMMVPISSSLALGRLAVGRSMISKRCPLSRLRWMSTAMETDKNKFILSHPSTVDNGNKKAPRDEEGGPQ